MPEFSVYYETDDYVDNIFVFCTLNSVFYIFPLWGIRAGHYKN